METPDRYWSGLYWDGIDPHKLDAVPLLSVDISSLPSATLQHAINDTINRLTAVEGKSANQHYYITLMTVQSTQQQIHHTLLQCSDSAPPADSSSSSSSSSCFLSSSLSSSSLPQMSSVLVCRLWHENVFLGAREAAVGDPGAQCRDLWYHPETGEFLAQLNMEHTDACFID